MVRSRTNGTDSFPDEVSFSLAQLITLACVLEATAPKPGNVHRGADFDDTTYIDFLAAAIASGPALAEGTEMGVGKAILNATRATRRTCDSNPNLGMLLLLAPLAAVPLDSDLPRGVSKVLGNLSAEDTAYVYQAIRLAQPGGLGESPEYDVRDDAPDLGLQAVMAVAADRDLIACQYENGYREVFLTLDWICDAYRDVKSWTSAIIHAYLRLMAAIPDSLIARKCGSPLAQESAERAAAVLAAGKIGEASYVSACADFDFWLRADGHRRNPGTSADCIAAALFAGLRDQRITPPFQ